MEPAKLAGSPGVADGATDPNTQPWEVGIFPTFALNVGSKVGKISTVGIVECATAQEALDLLHHCLDRGGVIPGRHFREELAKEGLSIGDAFVVLDSGRIYNPPEPDIRTGEWKWRVEGREPGGQWIAIVFSFKTVEKAFLITIFSIELRNKRKGGTR
jgi:hypothetical protein